MDLTKAATLLDFVTEAGLCGLSEVELVHGFCERLRSAGIPATRVLVLIDTLHPIHEGHVFRWRHSGEFTPFNEYGRVSDGGDAAQKWASSPFNYMLGTGATELRRRLAQGELADFPLLQELRSEGQTDYIALTHRFGKGALGEMDAVHSSWATDTPEGFEEPQLVFLRQLLPAFALALKCISLGRVAETIVQTYLGRDAGQRVLSGRIARGVADRISAVIWYSDLRDFTRITDAAPYDVIPFLNDYADAIISSVHEAGGDVLKLIGDGVLAIFKAEDPSTACASALRAEALMRVQIEAVNASRSAQALPVTDAYLSLHIGEVFYGNIGSQDRLDFTVVGPAVNEASRIAALCRSVEKDVLISSAFAAATQAEDRARFVGVGRYALRGVEKAQEFFTLERV
jgi:adenylate cyclase